MSRVERHAGKHRISVRTLMRWLRRYRTRPGSAGVVPARRGPKLGQRRLLVAQEKMIGETIEAWVSRGERLPLSWIIEETRRRCKSSGAPSISRNAVVARLRDRGIEAWRTRLRDTSPTKADVGARATLPLEIVQIDHTLVDVMVVDAMHRRSIGRPWITVAFDVATRVVLGFHLTLEAPSSTSVGLALAMAGLPKTDWLRDRGLQIEWAPFGIARTLHLDNGAEFHSMAFQRGCERYGIQLEYRPPGRPHFGGHIERYLGTLMRRIHGLPGTTHSNPLERGKYRSDARANMTLEELERWVALEIAGRYHQHVHRGLHAIPAQAWDRAIGGKPRRQIDNPVQFVIDFLPAETRRITKNGFQLGNIRYWDPLLSQMFPLGTRVLVRIDPRDLSKVFVPSLDGAHYLSVPYADLRRPTITIAEREHAKRLAKRGEQWVTEDRLFAAAAQQRRLEEAAQKRSSRARRSVERRPKVGRRPSAKSRPATPIDYTRAPIPYDGEEW